MPTLLRFAFPWGKVAPKGPDEGRDALSILRVGAAACPDALKFHTQKQSGVSLPLHRGAFGLCFIGSPCRTLKRILNPCRLTIP